MSVRYSAEVRRSLLAKHFLLREADPKTLDQLAAASVVVSYGNRQRIFDKGDDGDRLLGVLAGQVRIYVISSEGRELIMNVIMPGELFGEISLIDGKPRSASAVAIGDTDLLHIRRADLQSLLQKNSELCFKFMSVLCERVRWTSACSTSRRASARRKARRSASTSSSRRPISATCSASRARR
jgi:CRP-like cAMP-binding protein